MWEPRIENGVNLLSAEKQQEGSKVGRMAGVEPSGQVRYAVEY